MSCYKQETTYGCPERRKYLLRSVALTCIWLLLTPKTTLNRSYPLPYCIFNLWMDPWWRKLCQPRNREHDNMCSYIHSSSSMIGRMHHYKKPHRIFPGYVREGYTEYFFLKTHGYGIYTCVEIGLTYEFFLKVKKREWIIEDDGVKAKPTPTWLVRSARVKYWGGGIFRGVFSPLNYLRVQTTIFPV